MVLTQLSRSSHHLINDPNILLNFREVQEQDGSAILDFDQLNYLRREGLIFRGYSESEITFPPTYKYDVGTRDNFDTSHKQRTPSFTDRILYKVSNWEHYERACKLMSCIG